MKINSPLKRSCIAFALIFANQLNTAFAVDFNTDVLDAADKENLDLARFSQPGYIMPGQYQLQVLVNGEGINATDFLINFIENSDVKNKKSPQSRICVTKDIVDLIGLTTAAREKITWWDSGKCADFSQLAGVMLQPTLADGTLNITIPQAWLEYSDSTWLPPSRWDQGIAGFLLDYNVNGSVNKPTGGQQSHNVSYNGTVGFNFDAWRLRGDYQGNLAHTADNKEKSATRFDWNRFYLFRSIARWKSNLTLGQNYISSDIFNSWRYTGVSLESDDRMLPPKLRGYAPQVSGVANTNARVLISQQGRVLYDSTVPAGPFVIRDLDSSVRGRLDVEIIEQNGEKKTFQVNTAYVPYLTRPGRVRYKAVSGHAGINDKASGGPLFAAGEVAWGINNNWSLYGGGIFSGAYNSVALGVGRDLNEFGTLAADVTQSVANFSGNSTKKGKSWRLSYSKFFDETNTDITFAGYRFSERNYMTMEQYLNARYNGDYNGREKEQYTITLNKQLTNWDTSVGIQYNHQTYWDRNATDSYTLSVDRYIDVGEIKDISLGLTASRYVRSNKNSGDKSSYDDAVFLRLSLPMGTASVSSSSSLSNKRFNQTVGYSNTLNDGLDSYSINAGVNAGGSEKTQGVINGYYSHANSMSTLSANFAIQDGYTSFGANASGGLTITAKGAALHGGGINGGTRLLVDTDGVAGVPVDGGRTVTNRWGLGVITNVSSYYRNTTSIDVKKLPDDVEAIRSVSESMLTEGAIGYRKFEVLKGNRVFAVLRLADNSHPPFGASVTNAKGRELGMIGDNGLAWLSGIKPGETVKVGWNGREQCTTKIPDNIESHQQLLLPCNKTNYSGTH